jgi:hypothetical protein
MTFKRITVKFFARDENALPADEVFQIFNHWISAAQGETLIDVADYSHIHDGPVTLLVGHEADYATDISDGQLGLLYTRKQPWQGDQAAQLSLSVQAALNACRRLEEDALLGGNTRFNGNQFQLGCLDRLNAPNTDETLASIQGEVDTFLNKLFGGATCSIERDPDPKRFLKLSIKAESTLNIATLLHNISS